MLRDDLILSLLPTDAPDLIQQKLFSGEMKCFYDAKQTERPVSIEAYLAAEHAAVRFVLGGAAHDVMRKHLYPWNRYVGDRD